MKSFNPLNAELNPICHLLALLGAHHIFHVSGLRVKSRWVLLYSFLIWTEGGKWLDSCPGHLIPGEEYENKSYFM